MYKCCHGSHRRCCQKISGVLLPPLLTLDSERKTNFDDVGILVECQAHRDGVAIRRTRRLPRALGPAGHVAREIGRSSHRVCCVKNSFSLYEGVEHSQFPNKKRSFEAYARFFVYMNSITVVTCLDNVLMN